MKTQILRLEAHDDVISARDKMQWSQTGRILLVWPERGRILTRRLDLILLLRHSQSLGAQLALITRDPQVCYHAAQLGIPVFKDLRQAQKSHWRTNRSMRWRKGVLPPQRRSRYASMEELRQQAHPSAPPWLSSPVARIAAFMLSLFALLSIAAVIFPGAEITITPQSQEQTISLDVRADPKIDTINLSGAVPARTVEIVVSGEISTPAKGFSSVPAKAATVDVLISNVTDQVIPIPEGTVVRTKGDEPRRFSITRAGRVPAGVGQSVSLPARALIPGVQGNQPAESLRTIEGPLGTQLTVTNPLPATGGTNRPVQSPTAFQRDELYEQFVERLRLQALEELSRQIQPSDLLLTPTLTLTQVIRAEYDPPQDQPSDWLNLVLTLGFQAQVATHTDLESLAKTILDANIPAGYHAMPGTVGVELQNEPRLDADKRATWRVRAAQRILADLEGEKASSLIRGLAPAQANEKLRASLPIENTLLIRTFPSWWPRLPVLPFRISIRSG
jgi:hypothetical protein